MKNIALLSTHEKLGAKIVPFAGFNMPVQYSGVKDEHLAVRYSVGVFDVSHMGEFIIEGPNALDFIQKITSNDVSLLIDGQVQYSCFPNLEGGIVDDLLVYRFNSQKFMLVVNASNIDKDLNWIKKFNNGSDISNISDQLSLLAIQGPKASDVVKLLTDIDIDAIPYYNFKEANFCGINNVIISATGYTGSGGFEIYFPNKYASLIWDKVFEAGKAFNIKPAGLAARDTLRLEMGYCLYGNDIDDSTSPIEAGLGWITKFNNSFNNSEFLKSQKENGVKKRRVGFMLLERGIPRKEYQILDENDNLIGLVTSGTMSPSLNKAIGMGYVNKEYSKIDTNIFISIRNKKVKAKICKLPFYV
jgi:aminomethyltransferase